MIPTTTAALRNVEALQNFATAYGVALPADVVEARTAALQIARDARQRPAFDMRSAARAAVGADVSKSVKSLAKDAQADAVEREAMSALVEATAERTAAVAHGATYAVVEAALTGPTLEAAAAALRDVLAAAPALPPVVQDGDLDGLLLHTQVRKAERVAHDLIKRALALPGFGGAIDHSVLVLVDPRPALEAGKPHATVRAATKGIAGPSDLTAWQSKPMMSAPVHEPIYPLAPAALLVVRLGGTVSLAADLDEVDARHAAIAER